jgi:hypothetical protein
MSGYKYEWLPTNELPMDKAFEIAKLDQQLRDAVSNRLLDINGCLDIIHNLNCLYQGTRQMFNKLAGDQMGFEAVIPAIQMRPIEDGEITDVAVMEQETLDAIANWIEYASEIAPPPPTLINAMEQFLDMISPLPPSEDDDDNLEPV